MMFGTKINSHGTPVPSTERETAVARTHGELTVRQMTDEERVRVGSKKYAKKLERDNFKWWQH